MNYTHYYGAGVFVFFSILGSAAENSVDPTSSPAPTPATEEAPASRVLTLEECIRRALASSPEIMSAEHDVDTVRAKLTQAKGAYILPDVKLRVLSGLTPDIPDGSGPPNFPHVDTSFTDLGPFFRAKIEAVQPLYTFGRLSNAKEAAQHGVHAKEGAERAARNEVVRQVKKVYHGLTYLFTLDDFLREINDRVEQVRERVEELIHKNSPEVTDIDLMRLDVFQAEAQRRTLELRNGIGAALKVLSILTGISDNEKIDIADRLLVFPEIEIQSVEQYLTLAKTHRPELQQLSDAVAIRRSLLKVSRADFLPLFFLGGFYEYAVAPGREDLNNPYLDEEFNASRGGGAIGLEQKLSFHMTSGKKDEAKGEYLKALADERRARQGIEIQIRKAHSDVMAKKDAVAIARTGFKAGRSWVTANTLNFGVGVVSAKDLLESFVAYSRVKVSFMDTIHDYFEALSDLSFAAGQEVAGLKY